MIGIRGDAQAMLKLEEGDRESGFGWIRAE